jgi:hypothetical protein
MSIAFKSTSTVTEHAVCAAAGMRDGLRTAQFYVRDLTQADQTALLPERGSTWLSRLVASWARAVDWVFSKGADVSVRLFVPKWRDLPSPFAPGMRGEVIEAVLQNRLVMTSLFTAYFFRSAKHILARCTDGPYLLLEHRVDAARRRLVDSHGHVVDPLEALAAALLALVEANAIARTGVVKPHYAFLAAADKNVSVMAAACVALLIAEEGKPVESLNEDAFFAVAGALLAPRLPELEAAVAARDEQRIADILRGVQALY